MAKQYDLQEIFKFLTLEIYYQRVGDSLLFLNKAERSFPMATLHKYKKKGSTKDFWEYRIYYQDSFSRKTREKSKKGFTSKAEAKIAAEEMEK
ncbi:hypothetical protein [Bacillus toyonensis]|uniref:hypothetical protein n=1 Tax=Bacillus toyonensis TaxID=155322 RepID=UPI0020D28514|nr:hypothetical protein [Bacillus toyonensis]